MKLYVGSRIACPRFLRRHVLHFEVRDRGRGGGVRALGLPQGARVLDAGAGEGQYAHHFRAANATAAWTSRWATRVELQPPGRHRRSGGAAFPRRGFDAAIHIVTLEHCRSRRARWRRSRARSRRARRC